MLKPVLIACECSQVETSAFHKAGYQVYSCDLQPCRGEYPGLHFQCDVRELLVPGRWGMIIAHPPCTYLSNACPSSLRTKSERMELTKEARDFFYMFYNWTDCPIAIENPLPFVDAGLPPYTQLINPYNFGSPYAKRTLLWLKDLPPLMFKYTGYSRRIYYTGISSNKYFRSRGFEVIAEAFVEQWSPYILSY